MKCGSKPKQLEVRCWLFTRCRERNYRINPSLSPTLLALCYSRSQMGLGLCRDFNLPLEISSLTLPWPTMSSWTSHCSLGLSLHLKLKKARPDLCFRPHILMSLLTDLHLKVPALIYENLKSETLCSTDGERRVSSVLFCHQPQPLHQE